MRSFILTIFASILSVFSSFAQSNNCPDFSPSNTIYAGLEIGSRGMKPAIIRFEEAEAGKTSFIVMSKDLVPLNTNPAKAKSKEDMDCTVDKIVRYVNVFRNDPYNVPDNKITVIISSGLKSKLLEAGKDSLLFYLKDKVKRLVNLNIIEMSDKEEGEFKVKHLDVDEENPYSAINVVDIGSGNVTGGFTGKQSNSFSTEGSINNISAVLKEEIVKRNWNINLPNHRGQIAQLASTMFKEKYLSQIVTTKESPQVVFGGGISFVFMTWFKAESFSDKRLNPFYTSYVYDYYTQLTSSQNKEEFFKNNRAKDNSPLTWKGKTRLKDAQAIFNDLELLVGSAILKTICDELGKRGIQDLYFDDQMLNSGLRYYLYQKYDATRERSEGKSREVGGGK
jgi:hypothetical protein